MKINYFYCVILLCEVLLLTSCFKEEHHAQVIINDGEMEWTTFTSAIGMTGIPKDGSSDGFWMCQFFTETENSLRSVAFNINSTEPGVYSGTYDDTTEEWSSPAIKFLTMTIDYDGVPYPKWYGQSATVNILEFDRDAKMLSATINAIVKKEGSSETRNISINISNLILN